MEYKALRPYQNAIESDTANLTNLHPYMLYYLFPDNRKVSNEKDPSKQKKDNLITLAKSINYSPTYICLLESLAMRQLDSIEQLKNMNYYAFEHSIALLNHAMPGQGIPSSFENGLSLHSVYGFPFFPSSSVKGIVKSWIVSNQCFGNDTDPFLKILFGNEDQQGKVIFFDVFPSSKNTGKMFTVDILNPHFPDYYDKNDKKSLPTDDQTPIPITFLAIRKDTEFVFRWTLSSVPQNFPDGTDVFTKKCNDIFIEALQYQGIGAKTSLGYGMFQ